MDDKKNINFKINEELRRRFKGKCSKDGMSMQTVLTALIEEYVRNGCSARAIIIRDKPKDANQLQDISK